MTMVYGSVQMDAEALRTMTSWPESTMFFDATGDPLTPAEKRLAVASEALDAELAGLRATLWEILRKEIER